MFSYTLCCCTIEEVVIPETPAEAALRLAKVEIYSLQKKYAHLVGRKFQLEPAFPALGNIDMSAATAMIASLKEKIETMTAELDPGLVLRTAMSPEDKAEIIRLRAEYDALQPSVVPFGPLPPNMTTEGARMQIANLRIWIADLKANKERTTMSPEDKAEIIRLRAEYEALDPYPCVRPYGPIEHMNAHSAISHIANLRLWIADRKMRKERMDMDMTRGGHGGSMTSWVGSDGHTLPGFPGPPRGTQLANTRPVL